LAEEIKLEARENGKWTSPEPGGTRVAGWDNPAEYAGE